jgi:site-specific DNA-cytosine methylase
MKAVGVHVFAGGFTMGVSRECEILAQLECHGFGLDTARHVANNQWPVINAPPSEWPVFTDVDLVYGNPRCTGFSTMTSGYDEDTHGPWSKQCQDIHDLCGYGVKCNAKLIIWESVQQAYCVGKPLLDKLRDSLFVPAGYKLAHVFMNAASFGNAQQRKRYFFVAYRQGKFNVSPPELDPYAASLWDAIGHAIDRPTHECTFRRGEDYDDGSYIKLTPDEEFCVPLMPNGWDLNTLAKRRSHVLPPQFKLTYDHRGSDIPFSLHTICRIVWDKQSPTLHSSSGRMLHPERDRPLTVGELSMIMGWPCIPRGYQPQAQIAKGVVPAVGQWLAQQARACIEGRWHDEADFELSFDSKNDEWIGREFDEPPVEKVFDLTQYCSKIYRPSYRPMRLEA